MSSKKKVDKSDRNEAIRHELVPKHILLSEEEAKEVSDTALSASVYQDL
ncbi:MAG: hypothetical protein QXF26_00910 [Candidatus Bathyarchaeia archaeon]